jgi:hypothetical protein
MNTRKEITILAITLISGIFVIILMSLVTLIIYAVFISPFGRDILISGIIIMLLIAVLLLIVGLNLAYFSVKIRMTRPHLARILPSAFSVTTLFLLMFPSIFNLYTVNAKVVVFYFLFSAVAFSLLSTIIYFKNSKSHSAKNKH